MIDIYTDGSCNNSQKPDERVMGYAYVVIEFDSKYEKFASCDGGTNNRAELLAILEALKYAKRTHKNQKVRVHTDSEWSVKCLNNEYECTKNSDLLTSITSLSDNVEFVHVKGHTGIKYNERADELAQSARIFHENMKMEKHRDRGFKRHNGRGCNGGGCY